MVARRVSLLLASALLLPSIGMAAPRAGRVVSVRGDVSCQLPTDPSNKRERVTKGYRVVAGATLRTGAGASARIVMRDKSILALGADTEMRIASYGRSKRSSTFAARLRLGTGRIWARVSKWMGNDQRQFEVETANAVAGVRGTEFVVHIDDSGNTNVWVVEGEVEMGSAGDDAGIGAEAQLVGGNQHGSVGADGQVQVDDVTPDQVVEQVGSVGTGGSNDEGSKPGQQTDPGSAGDGGDDGLGGDDDEGEDGQEEDERDDDEADEGVPPIELDPGSGNARVRGRIEVRD